MITIDCRFLAKNLLLRIMTKNGENWYYFSEFFAVFRFSVFS